MERLLLGVFYLSGWFIFSTCRLHQYQYVPTTQTWTEAQTYCREKHTDLATIRNTVDTEHMVSSTTYKGRVWIGLYSVIDWKWSDGYRQSGAGYENWDLSSYPNPDFYSGTQLDPEFVLVNEKMNWFDAQRYCRKNFIDLATVTNDTMSQEVGKLLNTLTWIGGWIVVPCDEKLPSMCYSIIGWFIFSTCRLHQYQYVPTTQTWTEAQTYCREKHTDLATIRNTVDTEHMVSSTTYTGRVWIGLYSVIDWKWSDGYRQSGAGYENWESYTDNEPDFSSGTQLDPEFVLVNEKMNWFDAQRYCRKNFIDLATVTNDTMSQEVGKLLNTWTWIGLYRDPNIYWSDGSSYSFSNWLHTAFKLDSSIICVAADFLSGRWIVVPCDEKLPSMCYSIIGWFIFSTCRLHQYQYVPTTQTWTEAQTYCREKHTDLATIRNTVDTEHMVSSTTYTGRVWIGLYSVIDWKWSDGYRQSGAGYENWESYTDNEPDFSSGNQFCVCIKTDGRWWDDNCAQKYPFVCYNGTQLDPEFVLVNEKMNWSDAQRYCRKNFIDLATVTNDTMSQEVGKLLNTWTWIGLYRDPNIYWSDGSSYSFRYWLDMVFKLDSSIICVAADFPSGRWIVVPCDEKLPSMCYSIIVKKHVVKLRMKLEDSSVDLNDPAVKADILKKLQDRVTQQGVSEVTLKWREQPDGKVFHKEGKEEKKTTRKKTEL
ncbi:hypothetical protein PAMA_014100 [Pampus argenteus]